MPTRRVTTARPLKQPAIRFGITNSDDFGRIAIYTSTYVHVLPRKIGPEVSFVRSDSRGISAVIENIAPITIKVVEAIARYAIDPYGEHLGIRVSKSDTKKFASKIVFYKKDNVRIEDVYGALANAMYTHVSYTITSYVQDERPSDREFRARFAPGFPFDYSFK